MCASTVLTLKLRVQAISFTGTGQGTVLAVNSTNHLERREVKVGLQTATEAEVLSGLKENEAVVFGEQNQFKVGQLVSPKLVEVPAEGTE